MNPKIQVSRKEALITTGSRGVSLLDSEKIKGSNRVADGPEKRMSPLRRDQ